MASGRYGFTLIKNPVRKIFLMISPIFFSLINSGQVLQSPLASQYFLLGGYSTNQQDAFSFLTNPAVLSRIDRLTAGVYTEKKFMIKELSAYRAAVVAPTSSGNFGLAMDFFGFAGFKQSEFQLAYGKKLGDRLHVGLGFDYFSDRIFNYGNFTSIGFQAGLLLPLTETLVTGINVFNPVALKQNIKREKLASLYSSGIGFQPSDKFFLSAILQKEEGQRVDVVGGFSYNFLRTFSFSLGVATSTAIIYSAVSLHWKNWKLDISAGLHPQLGPSPGMAVFYQPQKPGD